MILRNTGLETGCEESQEKDLSILPGEGKRERYLATNPGDEKYISFRVGSVDSEGTPSESRCVH